MALKTEMSLTNSRSWAGASIRWERSLAVICSVAWVRMVTGRIARLARIQEPATTARRAMGRAVSQALRSWRMSECRPSRSAPSSTVRYGLPRTAIRQRRSLDWWVKKEGSLRGRAGLLREIGSERRGGGGGGRPGDGL